MEAYKGGNKKERNKGNKNEHGKILTIQTLRDVDAECAEAIPALG
jgi:hypothetical protein